VSGAEEDPRCPECGGPIGQTATYCMHCSTDLTDELEADDADDDGAWDGTEPSAAGDGVASGAEQTSAPAGAADASTSAGDDKLLADDGLVDNTLTVVVGIVGGIVVGLVGTTVLLIVTESALAVVFGLLAWLGSTAYLVRRRTVQGAVSKGAYAVAVVLLVVPLVALSPVVGVDGGVGERGGLFVVLLVFVAVPAGFAAVVGFVASRFVPDEAGGSEG